MKTIGLFVLVPLLLLLLLFFSPITGYKHIPYINEEQTDYYKSAVSTIEQMTKTRKVGRMSWTVAMPIGQPYGEMTEDGTSIILNYHELIAIDAVIYEQNFNKSSYEKALERAKMFIKEVVVKEAISTENGTEYIEVHYFYQKTLDTVLAEMVQAKMLREDQIEDVKRYLLLISSADPSSPFDPSNPLGGGDLVPERMLDGFEVTAYSPSPDENGGSHGKTASGTKLTPYRSAAVDTNVIPFGTIFMVEGSPHRWVAEDTGSAIKGKKIDICLPTKAEGFAWGRRKGVKVTILGNKVDRPIDLPPGTPASGPAKAVVDGAIVEMNKNWITYDMENRNVANGVMDCSLFTWYVFKKYAGINIGNTTSQQIDKGKKIMNKSDLRPGDLVFFHSTYRGSERNPHRVSHVGIYIGDGKMIHNSSSYKRIKIISINAKAFQGHYLWGERWF